jgi:hypothetical protein
MAVPFPDPTPTNVPREKKGKITVPLITSALIHGGIMLLLGGAVLVPGIIPKAPFVGEMVVPSALDTTDDVPVDDFLMDEPMVDAPASDMPEEFMPSSPAAEQTYDVIATTTVPTMSFSLPTGAGVIGTGTNPFGTGVGATGSATTPRPGAKMKTFFGSSEAMDGGLRGVFYDLKRTRSGDRAPSSYVEKVRKFTDGNWRPNILNDFYRVRKEMYATQFYIPRMPAGEAPKAFEVEKEVEPAGWVIHYTGQMSPPVSGRYRFVGYADDLLVVRFNGKVVLNGSRMSSRRAVAWTPDPDGGSKFKIGGSEAPTAEGGGLVFGNWIQMEQGVNYPVEILIGENPGGSFEAFLFIEQEGRRYKTLPDGRPILPLFRTANEGIDIKMGSESATPSFDPRGPVFAPVAK